ncbi:MAG: vitamin K epoxide reductase family protein [Micropruina sp.]|nr:MAG: vitamin K epoxide reductase family protein [Micropruina sp.]
MSGWVERTGLGLSLAGLATSAYLTYEHYTAGLTLACPEGGAVNCAKVTSSSWSSLFGVPVALLGLLYFVAFTALFVPAVAARVPSIGPVRLGLAGLGVAFVLYLVWAEFAVGAICLWCTVVHAITVALLLLLVYDRLTAEVDPTRS